MPPQKCLEEASARTGQDEIQDRGEREQEESKEEEEEREEEEEEREEERVKG